MQTNALGNIEMRNDCAIFSVNPKIYSLDIIYSAAYIMIDKAFIILDGNPEKEIKIEIRKKEETQKLSDLVREFNEELLNYSVYKVQSERNKGIRETILQRVLLTNNPQFFNNEPKKKKLAETDNTERMFKKQDEHDGQ